MSRARPARFEGSLRNGIQSDIYLGVGHRLSVGQVASKEWRVEWRVEWSRHETRGRDTLPHFSHTDVQTRCGRRGRRGRHETGLRLRKELCLACFRCSCSLISGIACLEIGLVFLLFSVLCCVCRYCMLGAGREGHEAQSLTSDVPLSILYGAQSAFRALRDGETARRDIRLILYTYATSTYSGAFRIDSTQIRCLLPRTFLSSTTHTPYASLLNVDLFSLPAACLVCDVQFATFERFATCLPRAEWKMGPWQGLEYDDGSATLILSPPLPLAACSDLLPLHPTAPTITLLQSSWCWGLGSEQE